MIRAAFLLICLILNLSLALSFTLCSAFAASVGEAAEAEGNPGAGDDSFGNDALVSSEAQGSSNNAPSCDDGAASALAGELTEIKLHCEDEDENALSYIIVSGPEHGELLGIDDELGTVVYRAEADYSGSDSFTFFAYDGIDDGSLATMYLSAAPANKAPVCKDAALSVRGDEALLVALNCSDAEKSPLSYSIVSAPKNGVLSEIDQRAATVSYIPRSAGDDSFTIRASDGILSSLEATIKIKVTRLSPKLSLEQVPVIEDERLICGRSLGAYCKYLQKTAVSFGGRASSVPLNSGSRIFLRYQQRLTNGRWVLRFQRLLKVTSNGRFSYRLNTKNMRRGKWRARVELAASPLNAAAKSAYSYFVIK